jgi:hypothetical protein
MGAESVSDKASRAVIIIAAGFLAIVSALPMFEVNVGPDWIVGATLPGVIVAVALSRNAHAFSPWIVVIANWVLYASFFLLVRKVVRAVRAK